MVLRMDQQTVITSIEKRAEMADVSIRQLCLSAGVHPTTFSRWKLSEQNPTPVGATLASIARIEGALSEIESAAILKNRLNPMENKA